MIWQIIKKQTLILLRHPQQLFLLIGLPIILITILGVSLSSFMDGEPMTFDTKVALIEQSNEQEQVERFLQEVEEQQLPDGAMDAIQAGVKQFQPVRILKDNVLGDPSLTDIIQLDVVSPEQRDAIIDDESYAAIIEIPQDFTYDLLQDVLLDIENDQQAQIMLYKNEGQPLASSVVAEILTQFQEELSLSTIAEKNGVSSEALHGHINYGKIASINERHPVIAKEYYTIGMAVMNVLFLASTIGSYAFTEKQSLVFNRIILANVSRWTYFFAILISSTLFAFIHLLIMFTFSWAVFGVTFSNIGAFLLITFGVALSVGGLSVLLTAISFRMNSEMVTNFFQSVIVAIFAFIGGSFFPIGDFLDMIQVIGNFTPNGAGMTAYLAVLRGAEVSDILEHLVFLFIFTFILVVVAIFSFPKRGEAS